MSGQNPNSSPPPSSNRSSPPALSTLPTRVISTGSNSGSNNNSNNSGRVPNSPQVMGSRSSLTESIMRGAAPLSPRAHRHPSLPQQAVQELLNNPPSRRAADSRFEGRDWRTIPVDEIVGMEQVRFVDMTTNVEDATNMLISSGSPNVMLLRDSPESRTAVGTFDYSDLNAYLLLVVGIAQPDERQSTQFKEIAQKGREEKPIPMKDVKDLGRKEPLIFLPHTAQLTKAVEIFGGGVHRIVIVKEHTADVVGVLTQLRLVQFFWENGRHFPSIEPLYQKTLKELDIGSHSVVAINGDKPLMAALEIMNNEGITSLPVLDNQHNVVGNISHVDVRLLTKASSTPLLRSSCIHFISVILSERGIDDGSDSYPVFYVNPYSTLAHTTAKLVATRSHRMWVVESPSPASSGPPTPALTPATLAPPPNVLSSTNTMSSSSTTQTSGIVNSSTSHGYGYGHSNSNINSNSSSSNVNSNISMTPLSSLLPTTTVSSNQSSAPPYTTTLPSVNTTITAANIPGASLSGQLSGVVSLTDILNLFARASGLNPQDPTETRRYRRRSSSASMRRSVDSSRSESVGGGSSVGGDLSRRGSGSRRG